jgi:hypothetical protein
MSFLSISAVPSFHCDLPLQNSDQQNHLHSSNHNTNIASELRLPSPPLLIGTLDPDHPDYDRSSSSASNEYDDSTFDKEEYWRDFRNGSILKIIKYFKLKFPGPGTFQVGDAINGEKINNKPRGRSTLTKVDGIIYDCQFVNGIANGFGKCTFPNKTYYEGEFVHGRYHGKGALYKEDGKIWYEGEFKYDKRHGNGIEYHNNGKISYEGEFVNEKFEGQGIQYYSDGDIYTGTFLAGKPSGMGTYTCRPL